MNKMIKVYVAASRVERMKCGRPSEGTVTNTIGGYKRFRQWFNERRTAQGYEPFTSTNCDVLSVECDLEGYDSDSPLVSIIKPQLIHQYLADLLNKGAKSVTAQSYICQLQQLFAKWVMPYYEDRGWKVPTFPSLPRRRKAERYQRPTAEQLGKVKSWYLGLTQETKDSKPSASNLWFAATMMLEFGMRNGDILRLENSNFVERDGRVYLNYTPNKTKNSSGRMVRWPVHPELWLLLKNNALTVDRETFAELNRQMRGLGFTGTKGAYELRKICIDHVYQRYGAEMATSISGDDIRTIMHYYADPSQPNIGEVRVTDLI